MCYICIYSQRNSNIISTVFSVGFRRGIYGRQRSRSIRIACRDRGENLQMKADEINILIICYSNARQNNIYQKLLLKLICNYSKR